MNIYRVQNVDVSTVRQHICFNSGDNVYGILNSGQHCTAVHSKHQPLYIACKKSGK